MERSFFNSMNFTRGNPVSLIVRINYLAVRAYIHSIGVTQSRSDYFQLLTIRRQFKKHTVMGSDLSVFCRPRTPDIRWPGSGFGKVKISLCIRFQVQGKGMKIRRSHKLVIEIFIIIRKTITVQIM